MQDDGLDPKLDAMSDIDALSVDAAPDGPPPREICDGKDNDRDQFVDEGTPEELCGPTPNGTARCNGTKGCVVGMCTDNFFDLDKKFDNGCECGQEATENGSAVCTDAIDLGPISDQSGFLAATGVLPSEDDVDFYRFQAQDTPDSSCDSFHVRVLLAENPGDQFRIDVWRGGCAGTQLCMLGTQADWYVNYQVAGSPPVGQCPCAPDGQPSATVNTCVDDGAEFVVRVSRKADARITCEGYRLELANGMHPAGP
jgi:hypothetical protein